MDFDHTPQQRQLRDGAAALGRRYGHPYFVAKAKAGQHTDELWAEAGALGYLGPHLPAEHGGGGAGLTELAIVAEELAAAGCPLGMLVASPAVVATIVAGHGTPAQRERFLPGLADGTAMSAFAITEPTAGSNFHRLTTTVARDGDEYVVNGQKVFVSGLDTARYVLIVARWHDELTGNLRPVLLLAPRDTPGLSWSGMEMELLSPERHFLLSIDGARLPAEAVIGGPGSVTDDRGGGLRALFSGLNPERIVVSAIGVGIARYALERASTYTATRAVWGRSIGSHQGVAHPLAHATIQVELARLMTAKAAALYDAGRAVEAGVAANMAKYASAEAASLAVDTAVQVHGGNGLSTEYGVATLLGAVRAGLVAPVSREMILNFVAQHVLGQERSY